MTPCDDRIKFKQKKTLFLSPPSPRTPSTPTTPGGSKAPLFSFADPAMQRRAVTAKDALLMWCQTKTFGYEVAEIIWFETERLLFCFLTKWFDFDDDECFELGLLWCWLSQTHYILHSLASHSVVFRWYFVTQNLTHCGVGCMKN